MSLRTASERLLLPAWLAAFSAVAVATDKEHDLFWMAREGQDIWAGGGFVHDDRWSWVPSTGTFTPTSPLWQLLLGGAWSGAGRAGLIALAFLTIFACAIGVVWVARLMGASPTGTAFALIPGLLLGGSAWSARAALPALVLLMWAVGALWASRQRLAEATPLRAAPRAGLMAFLVAGLGIWLHNSWAAYALALPVAVGFMAMDGEYGSPRRAVWIVTALGLGALLGAMTGPLGAGAWGNASAVAAACRGLVVEWMHPWQAGTANFLLWLAGLALCAAMLPTLRRRDNSRTLRAIFVLGAGAAAIAGAYAFRFSLTSMVLLLPALAAEISRGPSARVRVRLKALGPRLHEPYWRTLAGLLAAVLLPISLAAVPRAYDRLEDPVLPLVPRECRTFTDDAVGSVLTLARPDASAWIDGRLDYWGRSRMLKLFVYERGRGRPLLPDGTRCVLMERGKAQELSTALSASPQWRLAARSESLSLWLRRGDA